MCKLYTLIPNNPISKRLWLLPKKRMLFGIQIAWHKGRGKQNENNKRTNKSEYHEPKGVKHEQTIQNN